MNTTKTDVGAVTLPNHLVETDRRRHVSTANHLKRIRQRSAIVLAAAAVTSFLVYADPATAQETRAAVTSEEQANRAQNMLPPKPNAAERWIGRLEDWGLITGTPEGVYPWLGSVYPGGGFAAGAGVSRPFGDDGSLNVYSGYSISSFSRVQADLALPTFASNRARVTVTGRYIDAPAVKYFGVGNSSREEDQTQFGYTPTTGGARLDFTLAKYVTVGGGVDYNHIDTYEGRKDPSIEQLFSPADTPGLELSTFKYIKSAARASVDWRRPLGYSGRGGAYQVEFADFHERDNDQHSFKSLEAEALQLIPILRANWVVALRGLATMTDIGDSGVAPYFLLPSLGGGSTLRGYDDFRFRDRNRLLMNAELRWTPARFLDMAVFYDTGKVTSRREDLNFKDLEDSYGIGARLIGLKGYAFRVEAARSVEHSMRFIFTAGAAF